MEIDRKPIFTGFLEFVFTDKKGDACKLFKELYKFRIETLEKTYNQETQTLES